MDNHTEEAENACCEPKATKPRDALMEHIPYKVRPWVGIMGTYGLSVLWVGIIISLLRASSILGKVDTLPSMSVIVSRLHASGIAEPIFGNMPILGTATAVFFAPVLEEVWFRMIPITAMLGFSQMIAATTKDAVRRIRLQRQVFFAGIVGICVLLFGVAHGAWYNVLIQGVIGGLWAGLYLLNSREGWLHGYLSVVMVHSCYNFTVSVM